MVTLNGTHQFGLDLRDTTRDARSNFERIKTAIPRPLVISSFHVSWRSGWSLVYERWAVGIHQAKQR